MNEIQKRESELLEEIAGICRENDLRFTLFEKTAYQAYITHEFDRESYIIDIAMPAADAARLVDIVERDQSGSREIESWLNNPDMPGMYLRYVDKTTTLLDTSHEPRYRCLGMFVQIRILRNVKLNSRLAGYEHDLEALGVEKKTKKVVKELLKIVPRMKFIGKKKAAAEVYRAVMRDGGLHDFVYKVPRGRERTFEGDIFENMTEMEFAGHDYPLPADTEGFFRSRFGENWEKTLQKRKEKQDKFEVVSDTTLPYRDYLEYAEENNVDLKHLIKYRMRYRIWRGLKIRPLDLEVKNHWLVVKRTSDRISYWEQYYPQKDKILQLQKEQKWDELAELMEPYLQRAEYWRKKKLGFCFDVQIAEAVFEMLKAQGREDYAGELRDLIPPEHLKQNMDEYLRSEGVDISYVNE
ncbi:MAG: hypothetical protein ACOX4I_05925 [Anaerovoracaceae bacterium]|jgi:phosphorylcholine metabolism protein LicD